MLTQNKFIEFSSWSQKRLWKFVSYVTRKMGHTSAVKYLVDLRRDLQKENTIYAKTHKYDLIQDNGLKNREKMMQWCEGYYKKWAKTEVIIANPQYATKPRKVKSLCNQMWEKYLKEHTY